MTAWNPGGEMHRKEGLPPKPESLNCVALTMQKYDWLMLGRPQHVVNIWDNFVWRLAGMFISLSESSFLSRHTMD